MERLFVYGTLMLPKVQLDVFGRLVAGRPAVLVGWKVELLTLTDARVIELSGTNVHRVLVQAGPEDRVDGWVLELTPAELARADEYETSQYCRVRGITEVREKVWVYAQDGIT